MPPACVDARCGAVTYALGPSDFVEHAAVVHSGSYGTLSANEACTFTGGATAGAVGACVFVAPGPTTTFSLPETVTLKATAIPVFLNTNGAAATSSAETNGAAATTSAETNGAAATTSAETNGAAATASAKTNGAAASASAGFLLSAVIGFAVISL
jgi:hypothetical protein